MTGSSAALGSAWRGLPAGWLPALAHSQALAHVFTLVYQVETQLRAGASRGLCPEAGSAGLGTEHKAGAQGPVGCD